MLDSLNPLLVGLLGTPPGKPLFRFGGGVLKKDKTFFGVPAFFGVPENDTHPTPMHLFGQLVTHSWLVLKGSRPANQKRWSPKEASKPLLKGTHKRISQREATRQTTFCLVPLFEDAQLPGLRRLSRPLLVVGMTSLPSRLPGDWRWARNAALGRLGPFR